MDDVLMAPAEPATKADVKINPGKMEAFSFSSDTQMWIEKYRPETLDDIISHQSIIDTITKLTDAGKLPHLLFYGPPGTGKTSAVLAIARKLNGQAFQGMTLELNASDERGIDVVRHTIKNFASTRQIFSNGFKFVILDEADAMTTAAQFALRRVIEKFTKTTRFCLICNYVNKIIPALQSRCTKFRFQPLESKQIKKRLNEIATIEGVNLTRDGLKAITQLSGGDMRKCLNILQACHMAYDETNEVNVHLCTGTPLNSDVEKILQLLLNESFSVAFETILKIQMEKGLALGDIITHIHLLVLRVKFPPHVLMYVLNKMSDIEFHLTEAVNEKIQLSALVGIFKIAREKTLEINRAKQAEQQEKEENEEEKEEEKEEDVIMEDVVMED